MKHRLDLSSSIRRAFFRSTQSRTSLGNDERGGPMVEFAIILPVVLLLVFGVIQFGMVFSAYISLRNASSVAARYAALANGADDPLTNAKRTQISNVAIGALNGILNTSASYLDTPVVADETVAGRNARSVTLTYHYPALFPLPGLSNDGKFRIVAKTTMR